MGLVNPKRGEIALRLDGVDRALRLTLGALAALEHALGAASLPALVARLAGEGITSEDIIAVLNAGLYGGGYRDINIRECVVEGGAATAASAARQLIVIGIGDGI